MDRHREHGDLSPSRMDPVPLGWGQDPLSENIMLMHRNTYGTFVNMEEHFGRLRSIDQAFLDAVGAPFRESEFLLATFLYSAHVSYLASVQLATSGQRAPTYMVLRGCLENALYAFYIHDEPGRGQIWVQRDDDKDAEQRARNEFRVGHILQLLRQKSEECGRVAQETYEVTIAWGAHPNPRPVIAMLEKGDVPGTIEIHATTHKDVYRELLLIDTAKVAVCALAIFELVFQERFDGMALSARLDRFKAELRSTSCRLQEKYSTHKAR